MQHDSKPQHQPIKALIDTNIALDLLQARDPFVADAVEIFALAEAKKIMLYLSTDSLSTIFYVVEKNTNPKTARAAITKLLGFVQLCALDENAVLNGMALEFQDIEDAFICSVAESAGADVIITRNTKDFKNSPISVQTPREFLATLRAIDR